MKTIEAVRGDPALDHQLGRMHEPQIAVEPAMARCQRNITIMPTIPWDIGAIVARDNNADWDWSAVMQKW
jgi:hypothetical protein